MKVINQNKNKILADNAILAKGLFKRLKGLLGKKMLSDGQALILKPCNSIHTFFMCFPIDVLFLNKDKKVIKCISSLKPFRMTNPVLCASYAIELPAGKINASQTEASDTILIQ